jgi:hypothetical protein
MWLLSTVVLVPSVEGCGPSSSQPSATEVVDEIESIARGPTLFSFIYTSLPPQGRGLQFSAFGGVGAPCDLFQASRSSAFSFVKASLQHGDLGTYEVRPDIDYQSATPTAYLEWTRVADGKASGRARALTGTVTYLDGPTNEEEWHSVAVATASVSASFESDPLVKSNCRGGADLDAGVTSSRCTCERLSGATFVCDSAGANCCRDMPGELVHVAFEMRADRCAAACVATPDLLGLCRQL